MTFALINGLPFLICNEIALFFVRPSLPDTGNCLAYRLWVVSSALKARYVQKRSETKGPFVFYEGNFEILLSSAPGSGAHVSSLEIMLS